MAYTAQQLSQMLYDELLAKPGMTYDQVVAAATPLGVDLKGVEDAYKGAANIAYQNQYGTLPDAKEAADALYYLSHNVGNLDQGLKVLNNSQKGYNYDTEDIVAGFRETFGRNPTQEEYVATMAELGINNFDRSTLGESGNYTAATVTALESDPYAGRYAGYNPYDLPEDAANVSTNILGDKVQYISPITQRPVVASFDNGDLNLAAGLDVLTPQQIQSAIGLATATGGLTADARDAMMNDVRNATTMDDLYAAFSKPQAVAALDANGQQVGVGQTEAEARANVFNGINSTDLNSVYKALYKDAAPYKFSDTVAGSAGGVITPKAVQTTANNALKYSQLGAQQGLDLSSSLMPQQKFTNFGTFGAADNERLGAGSSDYQSELIKSLRESDDRFKSSNTGVNKSGYLGNNKDAQPFGVQISDASAFNPSVFSQSIASPEDVKNWNSYNTYRTNSLQAKTPYTSFEEWLAGDKTDGKPVVNAANANANTNFNDLVYGGIP